MKKMKNNYREALTEVNEILNYVPEIYIEKLPINLINFIKENKSENYIFHIDDTIAIQEQNIKNETKSFIAILLLKYWDRENQENLLEKYNNNEKKYQQLLHEKYNVNIFENKIKKDNTKTDIIEYKKQNVIVKFFKNILKNLTIQHVDNYKNMDLEVAKEKQYNFDILKYFKRLP